MRKEKKKKILELLSSVDDVVNNLSFDDKNFEILLADCQDAAIAIGTEIEKEQNFNQAIIDNLELFCELVYKASMYKAKNDLIEAGRCISSAQEEIKKIKETYSIVFLPYNASMWDSLESIWKEFSKDSLCETIVMPIPYYEMNQFEKKVEFKYEGNQFPETVPISFYEDIDLSELKPDIIFVHNPYDDNNYITSVHPNFFSDKLKQYTDKLVYVPYYVNGGYIGENYKKLPLINRADYIVLQSERAKNCFKGTSCYEKVLTFGSPKIDRIVEYKQKVIDIPKEWESLVKNKKVVMLNTTINDILKNDEQVFKKLEILFSVVKRSSELVLIWRPHPLLEATLKSMKMHLVEQYNELVDYYIKEQIGILDQTKDITNTIMISDAYIGSDYSSVITMFLAAGKPVFRLKNDLLINSRTNASKKAELKNIFGTESIQEYYAGLECENYTISDFFEDLLNESIQEIKQEQMEWCNTIINNMDGTCGQKTYQYFIQELQKNNF